MEWSKPKMQNLLKALVTEFGEGKIVGRKQINDFTNTLNGRDDIANAYGAILKNPKYKLGSARYIITMSSDPQAVAATVEDSGVSKEIKSDPMKLIKLLKEDSPPKKARQVKTERFVSWNEDPYSLDDMPSTFGSDDISDILRTM